MKSLLLFNMPLCKNVFTAVYVKVRLSHKKRKLRKKDNSVSSRIILASVTTSKGGPQKQTHKFAHLQFGTFSLAKICQLEIVDNGVIFAMTGEVTQGDITEKSSLLFKKIQKIQTWNFLCALSAK